MNRIACGSKLHYLRRKLIMSVFIIIFIVLTAIVVLLTIVGLRMPKIVQVEESILLNSDPAEVFIQVCDFENFVKWSPWTDKDPDMKMTFEGERMTPGSSYKWQGNRKVGSGTMEIIHIEVNRKVDFNLTFGNRPVSKAGFILEPHDGQTKLTWYLETDMGPNPISRVMGPMMKQFIGKDFRTGLNNLNTLLKK
jgi:hypothetical protein